MAIKSSRPDGGDNNDKQSDGENWDEVGYILSSGYRKLVLKQLAVGPATPSQIATSIDLSISHVSRALAQLRDHDLAELLVSEDRRKGRVYGITEHGADVWWSVQEIEGE